MANERKPPLNKTPAKEGHWVSGSSNRAEGYDIHPHRGDHGEAQKAGSPRKEDYDGPPAEEE